MTSPRPNELVNPPNALANRRKRGSHHPGGPEARLAAVGEQFQVARNIRVPGWALHRRTRPPARQPLTDMPMPPDAGIPHPGEPDDQPPCDSSAGRGGADRACEQDPLGALTFGLATWTGFTVSYLVSAAVLDAAPGDPLVPVTIWPSHPDTDDSALFHALNPRLAAALVSTYTTPGDLIVDLTNDLALAAVANAGTRSYLAIAQPERALPPLDGRADLVLFRWPPPARRLPAQSDGRLRSPRPLNRHPATAVESLRLCRQLTAPGGHVVITITPSRLSGSQTDGVDAVLPVTRAAGLGHLQHLILAAGSPPEPAEEPAAFGRYEADPVHTAHFHPAWSRGAALGVEGIHIETVVLVLRGARSP